MPIRGISLEVEQPPVPERVLNFRQGGFDIFDISEAVGVTMQAFDELRVRFDDRDGAEESIRADFTKLAEPGFDGRALLLPAASIPYAHIVATAEGKKPESVEKISTYPNLWTPGQEPESFTLEQLNSGPDRHVAQLAVFSSIETDFDPMLHYLGLPVDEYARAEWNPKMTTTQVAEAEADIEAFLCKYPDFTLETTEHRGAAMLTLMDRIRGEKTDSRLDPASPEFVLNQGYMRIPKLGRRRVGGRSVVGGVGSFGGQANRDGDNGYACDIIGVGLSVGLVADKTPQSLES